MVEDIADNSAKNSRQGIKKSYADLLLYYRGVGVGNESDITGAVITEDLIKTIERRFKQLGGSPTLLYLGASMPSPNGQLKKKEPKR